MNSSLSFFSAIAKPFPLSLLVLLIMSTACSPTSSVVESNAAPDSPTATTTVETDANDDAFDASDLEGSDLEGPEDENSEKDDEPSPPTINISATSVGAITSETRFDVAEIQALFPEFTVTESTKSEEGMDYVIILVADGDELLLTIDGTPDGTLIRTIATDSAQISSILGHRIGDSFSDIFSEDDFDSCFIGTDGAAYNHVICPPPAAANISYFFKGDWPAPESATDRPAISELKSAPLSRILWISRNS